MAGERIGYIIVSPKDKDREVLFDAIIFSLRTLGHVNATAFMQRAIEDIQNESVDIDVYKKKRDFLYKELTDIGYDCVKPEGAFIFSQKLQLKMMLNLYKNFKNTKF